MMAVIIEDLSKLEFKKRGPETAGRVYDWSQWLDGQARLLEFGVDFTCTPKSFGSMARNAKAPDGKRASFRATTDGKFVLQLVDAKPRKAKK